MKRSSFQYFGGRILLRENKHGEIVILKPQKCEIMGIYVNRTDPLNSKIMKVHVLEYCTLISLYLYLPVIVIMIAQPQQYISKLLQAIQYIPCHIITALSSPIAS